MRAITPLVLATLILSPLAAADVEFDSGVIEPGQSWDFTFTEQDPGGQWYHCEIHPDMEAMVHVFEEGSLQSHEPGVNTHYVEIHDDGTASGGSYSELHLSIEVGDTVVWTNTGQLPHTVTDTPDEAMGDDGHDHDDHDHGEVNTPGFGLAGAIGALGLMAFLRRR